MELWWHDGRVWRLNGEGLVLSYANLEKLVQVLFNVSLTSQDVLRLSHHDDTASSAFGLGTPIPFSGAVIDGKRLFSADVTVYNQAKDIEQQKAAHKSAIDTSYANQQAVKAIEFITMLQSVAKQRFTRQAEYDVLQQKYDLDRVGPIVYGNNASWDYAHTHFVEGIFSYGRLHAKEPFTADEVCAYYMQRTGYRLDRLHEDILRAQFWISFVHLMRENYIRHVPSSSSDQSARFTFHW